MPAIPDGFQLETNPDYILKAKDMITWGTKNSWNTAAERHIAGLLIKEILEIKIHSGERIYEDLEVIQKVSIALPVQEISFHLITDPNYSFNGSEWCVSQTYHKTDMAVPLPSRLVGYRLGEALYSNRDETKIYYLRTLAPKFPDAKPFPHGF